MTELLQLKIVAVMSLIHFAQTWATPPAANKYKRLFLIVLTRRRSSEMLRACVGFKRSSPSNLWTGSTWVNGTQKQRSHDGRIFLFMETGSYFTKQDLFCRLSKSYTKHITPILFKKSCCRSDVSACVVEGEADEKPFLSQGKAEPRVFRGHFPPVEDTGQWAGDRNFHSCIFIISASPTSLPDVLGLFTSGRSHLKDKTSSALFHERQNHNKQRLRAGPLPGETALFGEKNKTINSSISPKIPFLHISNATAPNYSLKSGALMHFPSAGTRDWKCFSAGPEVNCLMVHSRIWSLWAHSAFIPARLCAAVKEKTPACCFVAGLELNVWHAAAVLLTVPGEGGRAGPTLHFSNLLIDCWR